MFETAEQKKARIKKRNLLDFLILQFARLNKRDIAFSAIPPLPVAMDDPNRSEEEIWSAKTQMIRNRVTNQRRAAQDRWNRFSGTAGAGGRGL